MLPVERFAKGANTAFWSAGCSADDSCYRRLCPDVLDVGQGEQAFDEKQFWRVKQFFGKYMERAVARDPSVRNDKNITTVGRPFQAEPDFRAGKFNIDITTDTEYSERIHLNRDFIDSKENLLTYRRLTIPEMIELFGEA